MKTALITCGALGREVLELVRQHGWDADVIGITARHHLFPERIAPDVEARLLQLRRLYGQVIVVFGDCGSYGALDRVLQKHNIPRLMGDHCYEFYSGERFQQWLDEEPGTFFLTDFLVRTFDRTIVKNMGLDRHPDLKQDYFRHYRRVIYLAQSPETHLIEKAQAAADYLGLPLQIEHSGYHRLEAQLVELMAAPEQVRSA
ncbi:MAG: DUF1638 domain-containing protein [Anaerolineae bacterium]|nr:DUF1638 domain-containing protein [Anaerolineae bacterium]